MLRKTGVIILLGLIVFYTSCYGNYLNKAEDQTTIPPKIKKAFNKKIPHIKVSSKVDIRSFLSTLAKQGDLNIVATERVKGNVSIFITTGLKNITLGELLKTVLVTNKLAMEIKGNIITVMTESEFQALYGRPYNDTRQFKTIKLKHIKPSELAKNFLKPIMSSYGAILFDDDSMKVFIKDLPDKLREMEIIIKEVDIPKGNKKSYPEGK